MKYKNISKFKLSGFSSINTLTDDVQNTSLLWQKFMPIKMKYKNIATKRTYSVVKPLDQGFSFENINSKFYKFIGVDINDLEGDESLDFKDFLVEGGEYGVFIYRGTAEKFPNMLKDIIIRQLPNEGYKYDILRSRFEILESDYSPFNENAKEEIWIPIKKIT